MDCNNTDVSTTSTGLRERKRLRTRARLEEAAVALVLRDGLENTTVDAISELADVSPRTFFNYFESKDGAILGLRHTDLDEVPVAAELLDSTQGGLVETVVHLLLNVMGAPHSAPAMREDRLEIIRRYPQLLADQLTRMTQISGQLADAVTRFLGTDDRFADLEPAERAAQAELLLGTCGSALKVVFRQSATNDEDAEDVDFELRAVSLVHNLMGRLR
jgi:AcrR family transcriptional regulator